MFLNYSKLCVINFFAKKHNFYHQNTLLHDFRANSRNIIGRNPLMVIPLLANQDLTPIPSMPYKVVLALGKAIVFSKVI